MKKKSNKGLYWALGITILILLGLFSQGFILAPLERTKYIEALTFGYIKCLPTTINPVVRYMASQSATLDGFEDYRAGNFQQVDMANYEVATPYTCKDFIGMNEECTITMEITDDDLTPFASTFAQLVYIKQPNSVSFSEDNAITLDGGVGGYNIGKSITIPMLNDDVLWVIYREHSGLTLKKFNEKVKFIANGQSYALHDFNIFSPTSGQIMDGVRTGNCYLEDEVYKDRKIQYADTGIINLDASADWENVNKIEGTYTYFAGFVTRPNFVTEIFEGKEAYCMDDKMYETLEIKVNDFTYSVVNYDASGYIDDVVCCSGDETPDKLCQDHKWVDKEDAVCDLSKGIFCPQSTYQPFEGTDYKRYECVDGLCVAEILETDCNDNLDCPSGEVCVTYTDLTKNSCVEQGSGGEPVCGDLKCELNEKETCPADCIIKPRPSFDATYIIAGLIVLIIILLMLIIKSNMKKVKK